jgi:hypothetical protein
MIAKKPVVKYKLEVDNTSFNKKLKESIALVEKLEKTIGRIKMPKV